MKKYVAPVTEIINLEASTMVCASPTGGRGDEISDNSGTNPYQNPDWYQNDDIEDDDGDLNSTGKGNNNLWGEVDDENW